jgi:hypothetical protein
MTAAQTIEHRTGRIYDFAQVLTIKVPAFEADDNGAQVEIFFNDRSRHIQGEITVTLFGDERAADIGRFVMSAYDACAYRSVYRPEERT